MVLIVPQKDASSHRTEVGSFKAFYQGSGYPSQYHLLRYSFFGHSVPYMIVVSNILPWFPSPSVFLESPNFANKRRLSILM